MRLLSLLFVFQVFVLVSARAETPGRNAVSGEVSGKTMRSVYEQVKTPYKYGLVVVPGHDGNKIDSPTVFRMKGKWYMTYVLYDGRTTDDGRGYETWLAESDDLLHWTTLGRLLSYGNEGWDASQRAGYPALVCSRWGKNFRWKRGRGRYWMSYLGGDAHGYEAGTLSVGMAYTDRSAEQVHEWRRTGAPVLRPDDPDAGAWEAHTIYKSSVFRDRTRKLGAPFVMFYNAKGSAAGKESIGIALSDDMVRWRRYGDAPVLEHPEGITGDAQIVRMGRLYVMFYFGAFWKDKQARAFNRFACSYDLVRWTDWEGGDLVAPSEAYDGMFAHKSCVLKYKGVVYHFYCAVDERDRRGIAVATSRDMGRSSLGFD